MCNRGAGWFGRNSHHCEDALRRTNQPPERWRVQWVRRGRLESAADRQGTRGADGRRTIERWVGQRPHCDILRGLKPETLELPGLGVRTIGPTVHVQIGSEIVGRHPIQEQAYDLCILVT